MTSEQTLFGAAVAAYAIYFICSFSFAAASMKEYVGCQEGVMETSKTAVSNPEKFNAALERCANTGKKAQAIANLLPK
jgi:hypothetical protein